MDKDEIRKHILASEKFAKMAVDDGELAMVVICSGEATRQMLLALWVTMCDTNVRLKRIEALLERIASE